ncbi:MAG TPA: N-acetylglucosamine-6-phosphate deacetylase [Clostridiales bacterium]|nr:N-acetylglucosamine-6-phosphate deacetylase [Clostridiales bacterium]
MIYKNAKINGEIKDIRIENGKFTEIGKINETGIDLQGQTVIPGLIDIHTHGAVGVDTMDGKDIEKISEYLLENGITSWLPTTMTVDMEDIKRVTDTIPETKGAKILGYHLEGPYISKNRKGAQNEKYIKNPDITEFESLKNIKMVTLAPELSGSMEFIQKCNAVVSIGHTDCDYETAVNAIKNGAKCLTHTFNAMPPLNHRNPGPIGAAIDENIYVQVICDGLHIHKSVITMLYRTFGADRMILISDSMRATGISDGEYEFGGQMIDVKNGIARTKDGALAGSTSNLMDCVKKAISFGIPKADAIKMASETPAKLLGVKKGKIEVGYDADFVVVDDEKLK